MSETQKDFSLLNVDVEAIKPGYICLWDLYVYIYSEERYLQFAQKGEPLSAHKVETVKKLLGSNIFVKYTAAEPGENRQKFLDHSKQKLTNLRQGKIYEGELLGAQIEVAVKNVYAELLNEVHTIPPAEMSETLSGLADELLTTLAPEVNGLKDNLINQLNNMNYMTHVAGMTSMALLCAMANDFKSRTSLKHIATACLLMDAGLGDLEEHWLETYYRNRAELPTHIWERIKNHPVKSQQMIGYLPLSSDVLNQLILHHHELHNGKGYHRGIHNGVSIALARVLALAVDMFEVAKGNELRGTPLTLKQLFEAMTESKTEPHLRRHHFRLVENLITYTGLGKKAA